jgi:uncharacterized membrane protein
MSEIIGQTSIVINVPAPEVYAYLLDFTRHPEWSRNLSRVWQVSEGPVSVGTIFRAQEGPPPVPLAKKLLMMVFFMAGVASGAKTYSQAEITGLEPGRRIAWQAGVPKGEHYFNLAHWEIILEPQGQVTHLIQRFQYLPQTGAAERMVGAAGPAGIEKACAVSLAQLKTVLDQRAVQAGNETPNPKSQYAG